MTAAAENVSCVQAGRVRGDNESLRRANQAFTAENARLRNNLTYLAGEAVDEAERWAEMRPAEAGQALEALIDAGRRTAGVVPQGEPIDRQGSTFRAAGHAYEVRETTR